MSLTSRIRKLLGLFTGTALIAGCAGHTPHDGITADLQPVSEHLRAHAYQCEGGKYIVVERQGPDAVFLFLPARNVRLERTDAGDGRRYRSADGMTLRTAASKAVLTTPDGHRFRCREHHARSVIEDAKLRGVDYWARGADATWALEIGPDRTVLFTRSDGKRHYFPTPESNGDPGAGNTHYRLRTDTRELEITIGEQGCDMHAEHAPYPTTTIQLTLDGTALPRGCGMALH